MHFLRFAIVGGLLRIGAVIDEVLENGERRNREDLLLAHEAHGFVGKLKGVIDGNDSGAGGVERAGFAGGMNRDVLANTSGFPNRGSEFGFGVLIRRGEFAVGSLSRGRFRRS